MVRSNNVKLSLSRVEGSVQTLVMILVALLMHETGLVLLDEPDLSLHPPKIRELARLLAGPRQNKQLLIITHSHEMLLERDLPAIHHLSLDEYGHSVVQRFEDIARGGRQALAPTIRELFFSKYILFVEGQSDEYFWRIAFRTISESIELQRESIIDIHLYSLLHHSYFKRPK